MADNTQLNIGVGGDVVRDLARNSGNVKTQVIQLDIGGASSNAEVLITAGQQLASASVPVVLASNQPAITQVSLKANNSWGSATALTNSASTVLASLIGGSNLSIKGIICHGTADGYFFVQINMVTVFSGRTRSTLPMFTITLPNGIVLPAGATATLNVTNESGSTANYEGTLLGE